MSRIYSKMDKMFANFVDMGILSPSYVQGIRTRKKKYRCKVCGKWTYERSDRKKTCTDCREEYLNG